LRNFSRISAAFIAYWGTVLAGSGDIRGDIGDAPTECCLND
jgi:hypothetical protein